LILILESVLAIRDIGIQVKNIYANKTEKSRFIEQSKLADILIHEGIFFQTIRYYMTLLVKHERKTVVVFEHTLPKLACLLDVYRGIRAVMYGESEESEPIIKSLAFPAEDVAKR
jgi:phosphatidylinositol glycan class H protein